MTQEDKAKAYDKAIERAKEWFNQKELDSYTCIVESIFPELKESEDERIRKELIKFVKVNIPDEERYIAWLEKQGEQKVSEYDVVKTIKERIIEHFDNHLIIDKCFSIGGLKNDILKIINEVKFAKQGEQKPRFHEGDWIVTPENKALQITSIEGTSYRFNNESHYWEICYCDEQCRLWTIQDAKDGDVLFHSDSASNGIFIFKEILDRGFAKEIICYCDYDSEDHFCLGEHHTCCWADAKIIHPATKEQRDLLFKKMKEAGYMWDSESKQLLSLKTEPCDKQNSANLEKFINELSKQFPDVSFAKLSRIAVRVAKWAKPTDEEMKELLRTEYEKGRADVIAETQKPSTIDIGEMVSDYANNKERGNEEFGKPVPCMVRAYRQGLNDAVGKVVLKPAWSEEDENRINHLIAYFEDKELFTAEDDIVYANWLKSLKDKIGG